MTVWYILTAINKIFVLLYFIVLYCILSLPPDAVRQKAHFPIMHVKGLKHSETRQLVLYNKTGLCGTGTQFSVSSGLWLLLHVARHKHMFSVILGSPKLYHLIKLWMLGNQVRKVVSLSLWQCQKIAGNEGVLCWEELFLYSHFINHYLRYILC